MNYLNQINQADLSFHNKNPKIDESFVRMECERLIHAAVISRRFLNMLLTNPINTIEGGYCGEKFSFTQDEKQRIKQIRANNLAEFSSQLIQVVELSTSIPASAPEMAFVR